MGLKLAAFNMRMFSVITHFMTMSRFSVKQAINLPGLNAVTSVISKPSLGIPQIELSKLSSLNLNKLKDTGIKCLIFDKDNTLRLILSTMI